MAKFKKIYIEITNKCNKKCEFCSESNRPKREITLDEFEHILKEIKPFTNYIYLHIKGEPLLHSKISEIIDLCYRYNISVNITTNGSLIEKNKQIFMNKNTIHQLNISLQSLNELESYNFLNNGLKIIDKIIENQNIIIVYRFWALLNNQFTKNNKNQIEILSKHYNLDESKLKEIYSSKNITINKKIYINKAAIFEWPRMGNNYVGEEGSCRGLKTHIGILSDGSVVPCCLDGEGIINLGNIFEESLLSILQKNRTRKIVEGFKKNKVVEPLCQHCTYRLRFNDND